MYTPKMLTKLADEVDELLSTILGIQPTSNSPADPAGDKKIIESGRYRLPVNVTASGEVLDDDTAPTIIGRFTPGTPSPNHPTGHLGIDLQAPKGSPITSLGPGVVEWVMTAAQNPKGGLSVKIQHSPQDPSLTSYYAHLDSVKVAKGEEVAADTIVGTVGNSGNAAHTSSHLHFETKVNGTNVDPLSIVGKEYGSFTKRATNPIDLLAKMADEYQLL